MKANAKLKHGPDRGAQQLEDVWSITLTDISGFPHVEIAQGRDQAIAAFMSLAYMFVHAHEGEYRIVGEDDDVSLSGLHLLFTPKELETPLCVVSLAAPMVVSSQEGYSVPALIPPEFRDVAQYLQTAIEKNKPKIPCLPIIRK
jgi:hypothetical protein